MRPALSQVCSLNSPFEKDIEDYAAGKCREVEIWLTKLEQFLESHSTDDVTRLLEKTAVKTSVASYQGGLLTSQAEARRESWELFERRLNLCRDLNIGILIVACDIGTPLLQQDVERAQVSLIDAARRAEKVGVRLAMEFQGRSAFGNNLQTAAALVNEVGNSHLGICLDAFHYFVGPSKSEDLAYLTIDNLFHVQLCDIADVPREFATDSDRILPGEGDIPLEPIIDRLREIQYDGCVSIEIMNPQIWRVPAIQFGEIGITSLRKFLRISEPET